jgi:flagellar biosynthetic protein FliQ
MEEARRLIRSGVHLAPTPSDLTHGRVIPMSMTFDQAGDLLRHTLLLALLISAPMLCVGIVVGVIISLLQAMTQIQEQTLTFTLKIGSMVVAAVLLLPWIAHHLMQYAGSMFANGMP